MINFLYFILGFLLGALVFIPYAVFKQFKKKKRKKII